jgi:tRNA A-37 threonylcarbamoyl transferase component Bud32
LHPHLSNPVNIDRKNACFADFQEKVQRDFDDLRKKHPGFFDDKKGLEMDEKLLYPPLATIFLKIRRHFFPDNMLYTAGERSRLNKAGSGNGDLPHLVSMLDGTNCDHAFFSTGTQTFNWNLINRPPGETKSSIYNFPKERLGTVTDLQWNPNEEWTHTLLQSLSFFNNSHIVVKDINFNDRVEVYTFGTDLVTWVFAKTEVIFGLKLEIQVSYSPLYNLFPGGVVENGLAFEYLLRFLSLGELWIMKAAAEPNDQIHHRTNPNYELVRVGQPSLTFKRVSFICHNLSHLFWKGEDLRNGRACCIKYHRLGFTPLSTKSGRGQYPSPPSSLELGQNQLKNEAAILELLTRISIPNVPRLLCSGVDEITGWDVLVTDRIGVDSTKLFHKMRKGKGPHSENPESCIQKLVADITTALQGLHAIGIIHCDVHPGNILYDPETGRFFLIDFGLSRILDKEEDSVASRYFFGFFGTKDYVARSRHDFTNRITEAGDFESLFYVSCFLKEGSLPWLEIEDHDQIALEKDKFLALHHVTF